MTRYAFSVSVPDTHTATIERVTALLAAQGFGVLTRIDVHEVFQKKLGLTRAPYTILGACNPGFARDALAAQSELGILLPCNVVVEAVEAGCRVHVTDPEPLFGLADLPALAHIMGEVRTRMQAVVSGLSTET
jgi:uncharacterized protein (DUF302 family)